MPPADIAPGSNIRDIGHVDEVVFYSGGLSGGYLAAAQIKAAIDLAGISGNDFAPEMTGQTNAEIAFSGGIGPKYDDKFLHG